MTSVFLCLVSLWVAQAGPPRVVLLGGDGRVVPGVMRRLHAELAAAGFEVVERPAPESVGRPTLLRLARAQSAFAVIALEEEGASVEVWIEDLASDKAVIRTMASDDEAVVTTRVVELLRASLMELTLRPDAPALVGPAQALVALPLGFGERRTLFALSVTGGAGLASGARLGGEAELHVRAARSGLLGVRVGAHALGRVSSDAGSASLTELSLLADAGWQLHVAEQWRLIGSLCVGAHGLWAKGSANGGLQAVSDSAWTMAAGAKVRAQWPLGPSLALQVGVELLVGVPPIRIGLGGHDVASSPLTGLLSAGLVVAP